ncbi:MAG: DUF934 domain-containing protein [Ancalomicrobiaceae bacterium]|nr:DUF934 domain-containing protein [Ancalomicrobiaceae bacterium]
MSDVYRQGAFEPDGWRVLAAGEAVPVEGAVILPVSRFLAEAGSLPAGVTVGVILAGSDKLEDLDGQFARIGLITIEFPKFADGRGFSLARLLRERYGYRGPVRAVGDVLLDLIPLMQRVGFTEFVVTHEPTRAALAAGQLPGLPYAYQPGWDGGAGPATGRPWHKKAI